jgi:hypothetical protein
VTIATLHVLFYQLTVAADWCGTENKPQMICEVMAPKKTIVRELSFSNYAENDILSERAVNAYIDIIENSQEWKSALNEHGAFMKCAQILEEKVLWGEDRKDYDGPNDPQALIDYLRAAALKRHHQHVSNKSDLSATRRTNTLACGIKAPCGEHF